jgi:hypothetical protein
MGMKLNSLFRVGLSEDTKQFEICRAGAPRGKVLLAVKAF